jgi:hypothetical protein
MITELSPGVYEDITHEDYLALPYRSNSYLQKLARCPADVTVPEPEEEKRHFVFGRALHTYVLEGGDEFMRRFAVAPAGLDKRYKKDKDKHARFVEEATGKGIIQHADYVAIRGMRDGIYNHPTASEWLDGGYAEQTMVWDAVNYDGSPLGIRCKGRLDWLPSAVDGMIVDIKTTRSADRRMFGYSVRNYGYLRQAAMYLAGASLLLNKPFDKFGFIAVELLPPYRCECYTLTAPCDALNEGFAEYLKYIQMDAAFQALGYYPNYTNAGAEELYGISEEMAPDIQLI